MDYLLLASLLLLPAGVCALSRRRIEDCLPPAAFAEILIAYALSAFQALGAMRYLMLGAAVAAWTAALLRMGRMGFVRELKTFAANILTPPPAALLRSPAGAVRIFGKRTHRHRHGRHLLLEH